jgi:predicted MFS family arabinose efflux permease
MDRTILGGILMAAGAAIAVFFLLADPIGVTIGDSGFGWEETLGMIVGAGVFVGGAAWAFVERGETRTPLPH